jgi:hypothetical protein
VIETEQNTDTYVRLTKIQKRHSPAESGRSKNSSSVNREGTPDHQLEMGYTVDGWFLETPAVGKPIMLLRFRRNAALRIGLFTTSLVTRISEIAIWTENSVYKFERRSFEP